MASDTAVVVRTAMFVWMKVDRSCSLEPEETGEQENYKGNARMQ